MSFNKKLYRYSWISDKILKSCDEVFKCFDVIFDNPEVADVALWLVFTELGENPWNDSISHKMGI
jgi:hypothetical protein